MNEITISSHNNELLRAIEEIQMNDVEFGTMLLDDATSPENVIAYIGLASAIISLLAAILPLIAKAKESGAKKTSVYIRTTEVTLDLTNLVASYKEQINIEIIQVINK